MNCFMCVGIRKSGVCFSSKKNDEEREARTFCDDKKLLVEETPCTPTNKNTFTTKVFLFTVWNYLANSSTSS